MSSEQPGGMGGRQRDAIVYIPGLNRSVFDQSIDTIVHKLTGAFERQAQADLRFKWSAGIDEEYGKHHFAAIRTITVETLGSNEPAEAMIDVYELDYTKTLTAHLAVQNPLLKAMLMLFQSVPVVGPFLGSWRRPGKSWREIAQLLWLGIAILAVASFIVSLVCTAGLMALERFAKVEILDQRWLEGSALVAMISTMVAPWSIKQTIGTLATEYVCAYSYLRVAGRKPAVLGQALALLEHIAEKTEGSQRNARAKRYRSIHIVSYSFGSIVALDVLLPHEQPGKRVERVQRLVSIGCPFDLIRGFWPGYFRERHRKSGSPAWWLNVFSPLDVLGSNFRDDSSLGEATSGVILAGDERQCIRPDRNVVYSAGLQAKELGLSDVLMVSGLRAHSMYWMPGSEPETNCFDVIVPELYQEDPRFGMKDSPS